MFAQYLILWYRKYLSNIINAKVSLVNKVSNKIGHLFLVADILRNTLSKLKANENCVVDNISSLVIFKNSMNFELYCILCLDTKIVNLL